VVDDLATVSVDLAELDEEIRRVKRRALSATVGIVAVAGAVALPCVATDRQLALLPAAFVLGWLNLAGL
jgi:hypothetical protein